MASKFNMINYLFPRDTGRRKFFKNIYYMIHTGLSRLSITAKDSVAGMKSLRNRLKDKQIKPVLIFDHKLGGGSYIYREAIVRSKIAAGKDVIVVIYNFKDSCWLIRHNDRLRVIVAKKREQDLIQFLESLEVSEIIVNSLVSFPNPEALLQCIIGIRDRLALPLIMPLHDYYMICPSFNLLNNEYHYCGLPSVETCRQCLLSTNLEEVLYKPESIDSWRTAWQAAAAAATEITVFSNYSSNLLLRAYPDIDRTKIVYAPHKVDYIQKVPVQKPDGIIRIGIPGNLNLAKGSLVLQEMLTAIGQKGLDNVEIVVIGNILDNYCKDSRLTVTGTYRKENFHKIISSRKVNIIFIPSIWPETFSFTAEEAIMTGLPVAAFNVGAPAERLTAYPKSLLIELTDGGTALEEIVRFMEGKV